MAVICLSSCSSFRHKQQAGVAAEVAGQRLEYRIIDAVTADATDADDSARIADRYIRQWATDILVYEKAQDRASADLERLVEDYRRSLYVHEYEQRLVAHRKPKQIPDTAVERFYEANASLFVLRETIVKGALLIVPKAAPQQDKLRGWLGKMTDEAIEKIEKYAYQYATGYELFQDEWKTANQLQMWLPMQPDVLQQKIRSHSMIQAEDSSSIYLLQVTDKKLRGEQMPVDYAAPEIRRLLEGLQQKEYLQEERERLYEEALLFHKLKLYEK